MQYKKRMRLRWLAAALLLHCLMSFMLWGTLRVLQSGHNATHREQIAMANARITDNTATVQILHHRFQLPVSWLEEESPFYYAAYCLTDSQLHLLLYAAEFANGFGCS